MRCAVAVTAPVATPVRLGRRDRWFGERTLELRLRHRRTKPNLYQDQRILHALPDLTGNILVPVCSGSS